MFYLRVYFHNWCYIQKGRKIYVIGEKELLSFEECMEAIQQLKAASKFLLERPDHGHLL